MMLPQNVIPGGNHVRETAQTWLRVARTLYVRAPKAQEVRTSCRRHPFPLESLWMILVVYSRESGSR